MRHKQENPQGTEMAQPGGFLKRRLAMTYSPTARSCSTIGVRGLNFQVRNGFGWVPPTIVTSQKEIHMDGGRRHVVIVLRGRCVT
jgi:hypothetical protein